MSALTIVMYHYVRDLAGSRYPGLRALALEKFEGQLDYITRHYRVCSVRDVVAAAQGRCRLPPNACLLTFDDGFLDHFTTVLPRLLARGFPAGFYAPAVAVEERRVLDTHKVHFILAGCPDAGKLARRLLDMIDGYRGDAALPPAEALWRQYGVAYRSDVPEVVFVKRLLQRGLPAGVRSALARRLFEEFVGVDERAFAQELYMDLDQLRCLQRLGMEVGGHGAEHLWLGALDRDAQDSEITRTLAFLVRVHGGAPRDWVMCYPFGSYDEITLELLRSRGCALAMTSRVGLAADLERPLELPRLDTNDLPTSATAEPGEWTVATLGGGRG